MRVFVVRFAPVAGQAYDDADTSDVTADDVGGVVSFTASFKYLGSLIDNCLRDNADVHGRVKSAAAAFGAERVVLSDMDSTATFATETGWEERSTLEALAENAVLNGERASAVSIAELKWGCEAQIENVRERFGRGGFETLTASDVLYYRPDTYGALAATIRALAAADGAVVLAYRVRHGDEHGFVELLTRGTPPFEVVHRGGADARVSPQDRQSGSVKEKWVVELRAPGG